MQMSMFDDQEGHSYKKQDLLDKSAVIYEPAGRAREYAALAANLYTGCDHACAYCYVPQFTRIPRKRFRKVRERKDILLLLENDAKGLSAAGVTGQVHLCFTTDPYNGMEHKSGMAGITRGAITILHRYGFSVSILTKGGTRALRDLDLFRVGDAFGTTLTLLDWSWRHWEPNAAPPDDRILAIREFHSAGIPTWVSLEPVIVANASLDIIHDTWNAVDLFKVGKLNYHPAQSNVDWPQFRHDAICALETLRYKRIYEPDLAVHANSRNRLYYIKNDLSSIGADSVTAGG